MIKGILNAEILVTQSRGVVLQKKYWELNIRFKSY